MITQTKKKRNRRYKHPWFVKFSIHAIWAIVVTILILRVLPTTPTTSVAGDQYNYDIDVETINIDLPTGEYQQTAREIAEELQIDPVLFHALITQESGWDPSKISPKGAIGLTQTMPQNAAFCGLEVEDLKDPTCNLKCGAKILKSELEFFQGDHRKALGAYNAGRPAVLNRNALTDFKETRLYVARIHAIMAGLLPPEPCGRLECLRLKEGATSGGDHDHRLTTLALAIQNQIQGIIWFSGFNDGYQGRLEKGHDNGKAMDLTIIDPNARGTIIKQIQTLALQLFQEPVRIVDEYTKTRGTGGHLHVELKGEEI